MSVISSASYIAGELSVVDVHTKLWGTFARTRHDGGGCICVDELFSFFGSSRKLVVSLESRCLSMRRGCGSRGLLSRLLQPRNALGRSVAAAEDRQNARASQLTSPKNLRWSLSFDISVRTIATRQADSALSEEKTRRGRK